jgi:hypothetical protein
VKRSDAEPPTALYVRVSAAGEAVVDGELAVVVAVVVAELEGLDVVVALAATVVVVVASAADDADDVVVGSVGSCARARMSLAESGAGRCAVTLSPTIATPLHATPRATAAAASQAAVNSAILGTRSSSPTAAQQLVKRTLRT